MIDIIIFQKLISSILPLLKKKKRCTAKIPSDIPIPVIKFFFKDINVTECIVCVPGHDPLTFLSCPFLFDWVGVLLPQLSKVLKLVRWARRIHSSGAV